jgi:bacterioferritin (cytochrome b1)
MYPVLRPLLNKGGAGSYISRAETAERLLPLVEQHNRLLQAYHYALERLQDGAAREHLEALMPGARTHAAKLNETVYSAGGTPPLGTHLGPGETGRGDTDAEMLHHVLDLERDHHGALAEEIDAVHHQERTRAILGHVARGSEARLEALRTLTNRLPRPAGY